MQMVLNLGAAQDIERIRSRLLQRLGRPVPGIVRQPIGQLVKSLISTRTRDTVSLAVYKRLLRTYRRWHDLGVAPAAELTRVIADVTSPEIKAPNLGRTLRLIEASHPDFDLGFLAEKPVDQALNWLERLPGIGRKVSASVLNFSTLNRPAFVVDTHILRVLRRFGLVTSGADTKAAYEAVMAAASGWQAAELAELHGLLKRLGQTACRAEWPHCALCPLAGECRMARSAHSERANAHSAHLSLTIPGRNAVSMPSAGRNEAA